MRILCLGYSYSGRHLSRHFFGHQVWFLSRRAASLKEQGVPALEESDFAEYIERHPPDAVVDTVPAIPKEEGGIEDPPYWPLLEELLKSRPETPMVHVSSTSVYPAGAEEAASSDGLPTYNEASEAAPGKARGLLRLLLERKWIGFHHSIRIVRSGGIYGPDRCLALRFRRGDFRRIGTGNKMVSRVHVDDLCRVILASAQRQENKAVRLVNAVDARSTLNSEVFRWIEEELDIIVPGDWRQAAPRGRQVTSLYLPGMIGGRYRFPTYKEGFRDCLSA
ncbi:MAG TPA: NAD-dependent epimerase/dehydratase family protein [Acidobacteriota bacterium]|nr:NAD-dependent epimerase/dehydratase family protein [Acidobacteriota bacterium]